MQKNIKAGVITPGNYQKQKHTAFPVVYLLHGYSGNFSDWLTAPTPKNLVQNLSDKYQVVIVTPDGGYSSWYFDSPLNKASQYETFITKELVQHIDTKYRTLSKREGRFITGLSMGGHGALYLAVRNPEVYFGAGSMSGPVNLAGLKQANLVKSIEALIGILPESQTELHERSVVNMVPQLAAANLKLIIDCGVKDAFIDDNRKLHSLLLDAGVPHDYLERPGGHTWSYWAQAFEPHLLFFQQATSRLHTTIMR